MLVCVSASHKITNLTMLESIKIQDEGALAGAYQTIRANTSTFSDVKL